MTRRAKASERVSPRGVVWMVVGGLIQAVSLAAGRPLVVRGTRIPWGIAVVAVGLLILLWDLRKARKARAQAQGDGGRGA